MKTSWLLEVLEAVSPGMEKYFLSREAVVRGVRKSIKTLREREQDTLRKRFKGKLTFRAIGEQYGVSGERIRQVENQALRKLRHPSRYIHIKNAFNEHASHDLDL